jgi:hypothetical protein
MSFNPYQNYGAGIAALGPVQAMSDRNEAQTYMANGGQMFASGGIARLAEGGDADSGASRVYKYDPVTQTYTLQGKDEATTAMEEELLRRKRAAEAAGGSGVMDSGPGYAAPSGQKLGEALASAGIGLSKSPLSYVLPFGLGRLPGFLGERYIENRLNEAAKLGGHTGTYTGYAAFGDRPNNTMTEAQTQAAIAGTGGGPLSGPAWGASSISGLPSGYEGVGGPNTYGGSPLGGLSSGYEGVGGPSTYSANSLSGLSSGYEGVGGPSTYSSPTTTETTTTESNNDSSPSGEANGGLMSLARGGISHLGDYSDGGRLLRGPGDGVSDSIPAVIGNKRPARLADGEFVIPARIVSELGNGSTEAGARKLYDMMARIQQGRKKSIGKDRVAVNSRADKNLPA